MSSSGPSNYTIAHGPSLRGSLYLDFSRSVNSTASPASVVNHVQNPHGTPVTSAYINAGIGGRIHTIGENYFATSTIQNLRLSRDKNIFMSLEHVPKA